ncbi:hypothetical protein GRI38_07785 [Altererythrobacter aurantiacus]|uniref:Lipoprotein n=1 Tax=Parapontixanthobacter aurantiacus TaxID=1463599 RepID=A0A844ZFB7_9SPHN|nr:hypothetical protein [Parapontixanthobacter aurantiacus]MXO85932.1 hypothetical protein [Parapontixanthobacter aurantiacus]
MITERIVRLALTASCGMLAACSATGEGSTDRSTQPFAGLPEGETIQFIGTEPFWRGSVADGTATYITPDNQSGTTFDVTRFAGNNGVSFSGSMNDASFDLMVTPGDCSDGMSDVRYPYVATIKLAEETLRGCAWTGDKELLEGAPQQ